MTHRRGRLVWLLAVAFLLAALACGVTVGASGLGPGEVFRVLVDQLPGVHAGGAVDPVDRAVLLQIRLPRVLLAALVGALLAVAGAGYQGVFRNPLVDSSMLGSSAGAGLGATVAIVAGAAGLAVPAAAFAGALAAVALALAAGSVGRTSTSTLLLAGVAVGLFFSAAQTFVLQGATRSLQEVYAWLLGSLAGADWTHLAQPLPYAVVGTAVVLAHARRLDVLAVGEEEAASLGLHPARIRLLVVCGATLAAAAAVAVSGLIGFVGIVVPHAVRRLAGVSHVRVLPLSMLVGAGFLVLADTLARTVLAPAELPIGVVTAALGSPLFVWILRTTRSGGAS
ncbi:ABC transporter permease [Mangrovactinospora gilvigrisea]|uniref:ABC transporter permease n=1 Tax=Mangrovactinospora gilvigrisea TaxID=1428644 RepID=A0A1J7C1F2_9ACTN|nr:iron ABC transporter permease [Mangrovactinospora gilvigrisea]OIV35404.1 ABC transporter permease [Mangrovactinospora gilvigrisea]